MHQHQQAPTVQPSQEPAEEPPVHTLQDQLGNAAIADRLESGLQYRADFQGKQTPGDCWHSAGAMALGAFGRQPPGGMKHSGSQDWQESDRRLGKMGLSPAGPSELTSAQLRDKLEAGGPLVMILHGHAVTVVGVNGEDVILRDPDRPPPGARGWRPLGEEDGSPNGERMPWENLKGSRNEEAPMYAVNLEALPQPLGWGDCDLDSDAGDSDAGDSDAGDSDAGDSEAGESDVHLED